MRIVVTTTGDYPYESSDIAEALREAIIDHTHAYGVRDIECAVQLIKEVR